MKFEEVKQQSKWPIPLLAYIPLISKYCWAKLVVISYDYGFVQLIRRNPTDSCLVKTYPLSKPDSSFAKAVELDSPDL